MAKYGYRDITNVSLLDIATNEQIIYLDYLRTSSQQYGQERVYAIGGRGAPKLAGFSSGNSMKMELESALITPQLLSLIFGNDVETGSKNVQRTEIITATSNVLTLAATPVVGVTTPFALAYSSDYTTPDINLSAALTATPTATQYYISGATVTLNSSTYASGGVFIITYYAATTASNKRLKFQSDKFSKAYKLVGYTLFKNTADELFYPCRITIPKLQLEIEGATLNSIMNGDPTVIKLSSQALKPYNSTDLVIYDIDEGAGFEG